MINRKVWLIAGIVVVAVLALIYYKKILPGIQRSMVWGTMEDMSAFNLALLRYRQDVKCKQFPTTTLLQLLSDDAAGWAGPYMATIANDPWNNRYMYTSDGITYTVQSVHVYDIKQAETIRYIFTGSDTNRLELIPRGRDYD